MTEAEAKHAFDRIEMHYEEIKSALLSNVSSYTQDEIDDLTHELNDVREELRDSEIDKEKLEDALRDIRSEINLDADESDLKEQLKNIKEIATNAL